MANPNSLTYAKIPNALLSSVTNPTYLGGNFLRKTGSGGNCEIVIGPTKGHQYDKGVAADPGWRAGYSPGDDGRENDGFYNPLNATATSRYSGQSEPFEWWGKNSLAGVFDDRYVIVTTGGTGGVGFQPEDLEITKLVGLTELTNYCNRIIGSGTNSTEEECLNYLNGVTVNGQTYPNPEKILVLNTNYPNLPISKINPISNLIFLVDFGFIPCYSRDQSYPSITGGDHLFYNIGKSTGINPGSVIAISGAKPKWVYPDTSNCNGGALSIPLNSHAEVGYSSGLNIATSFSVFIWFKVNAGSAANRPLLYSFDGSGGYILETDVNQHITFGLWDSLGNQFVYASSTSPVLVNTWNLAVGSYTSGTGTIDLWTGDVTTFGTSSFTSSITNFSANVNSGGNNNLFIGYNPNSTSYLDGNITAIGYYEGSLSSDYAKEIYDAYQLSSYERGSKFSVGNLGRHWI